MRTRGKSKKWRKCRKNRLFVRVWFRFTGKTVGTACSPSDTCVDGSVCDMAARKCLLKAEQPCKGVNEKNCVSGASCGAANCECSEGYNKNSNKLCGKTVGTACSPSDTCVDGSVCDKAAGKCFLKVTQPCTGVNEKNCVFGASCGDGGCKCGGGYRQNSDLCEPTTTGNVGTTCTSGGNQCTTPNSVCSSLGACKCMDGFVLNIENGQCTSEVGKENGSTQGVASPLFLCFFLATTSIAVTVLQ